MKFLQILGAYFDTLNLYFHFGFHKFGLDAFFCNDFQIYKTLFGETYKWWLTLPTLCWISSENHFVLQEIYIT